MKKIIISIFLLLCSTLILITVLLFFFSFDEKQIISNNPPINKKHNDMLLDSMLGGYDLVKNFPYQLYLKKINEYDVKDINNHIKILNNKYPNDTLNNLMFLHTVYFDQLVKIDSASFSKYNPQLLWNKLVWVDQFRSSVESGLLSENNAILFNAIYGSWMQYIVDNLYMHYKADNKLKYLSSFKMLKLECEVRKYSLGLGQTRIEKIIERFTHNEFSYLYRKFLQEVNATMLILIILFGSIYIYGLVCIYKIHFIRK
jgi:hypothetical protein